DAVNVLMNQRFVAPYSCQVQFLAPQLHREYQLSVTPASGSFQLIQTGNGLEWSFDSVRGVQISESRKVSRSDTPHDQAPNALMLAFPLRLPIWGRANQYRIIDADRDGGDVILLLRHHDPHVTATLTVDLSRGVAVRFDSPTQSCQYL